MADGSHGPHKILTSPIVPSYCYDDAEKNCLQYGRLYTWESAPREPVSRWARAGDCPRTKNGGRLGSTVALVLIRRTKALTAGGSSGFNAVLGGSLVASTHDWKPTASTGPHQRATWPVDGITTSDAAITRVTCSILAFFGSKDDIGRKGPRFTNVFGSAQGEYRHDCKRRPRVRRRRSAGGPGNNAVIETEVLGY